MTTQSDPSLNVYKDILLQSQSILLICCDKYGVIKDINQYTLSLVGKDIRNCKINEIFIDFHSKLTLTQFLDNSGKSHLLNVNTALGIPQTFYFRCFQIDEDIILVGEMDNEETQRLRKELILINNELINKTRELTKKGIELEQLNAIKNQFLGIAAHDLRSPIGAIMNYTEFLLSDVSDKLDIEHISLLTSIKSISEFMLTLLNSLLDISAYESGIIRINYTDTDIVSLAKESIKLFCIFADMKGIKINLVYDEDIQHIISDPLRIRQVIDNLLNNAIKFSTNNTTITLKVKNGEQFITFSVIDQGRGISPDEIKKLFKPEKCNYKRHTYRIKPIKAFSELFLSKLIFMQFLAHPL